MDPGRARVVKRYPEDQRLRLGANANAAAATKPSLWAAAPGLHGAHGQETSTTWTYSKRSRLANGAENP